jgi:shikimate kinase
MNLKLKGTPGLYLVGFMASGKSTVGRHLAERLGWSFFDTDHEIEAAEKSAIGHVFERRGEAEFRRIEAAILREHVRWIERGHPAVLALGVGAFAAEENRSLLARNGITIWLDCPFEIIQRRVAQLQHGPLAGDPGTLASRHAAGIATYRLADIHVAIQSEDPLHTVNAILAHPLLK